MPPLRPESNPFGRTEPAATPPRSDGFRRLLHSFAFIAGAFALLPLSVPPGFAGDTILFHDGMRTLCTGRAWEEKDQVHCEYRGAVLSYPRRDVLRIEKAPAVAVPREEAPRKDASSGSLPAPAAPKPQTPQEVKPLPPPQPGRGGGPPFYDPRRPKRYWSSPTRHHDTYEQALAALAAEFEKPEPWIEERLAETNDLNEIRKRLKGDPSPQVEGRSETGAEERRILPAAGVEFYNPRRPKRYWTSPEAHHDTLADALQALAREFGKTPEWVERHMGESNDTGLIRRALEEAQQAGKP